jgi:1-acyl-sn-glycerol-3-phosphate acyltransferase
VLSTFERFAVRVMREANEARPTALWQRHVLTPFVGRILGRRTIVHGLERVPNGPEERILLVANHRTFFDLFALGWMLLEKRGLKQSVSFPVRATFFYENPLGLAICLVMSGGSMYPPFFRAMEKKEANKDMLGHLIEHLRKPGQLVGFHPEGTRSTGDDPYQLLPAKPGVGELALKARPTVVPAFINGMTNSLSRELRSKRRIIAVFGDPVPLPQPEGNPRLSHYKRCADLFNERIAALGAEEKRLRAELGDTIGRSSGPAFRPASPR